MRTEPLNKDYNEILESLHNGQYEQAVEMVLYRCRNRPDVMLERFRELLARERSPVEFGEILLLMRKTIKELQKAVEKTKEKEAVCRKQKKYILQRSNFSENK